MISCRARRSGDGGFDPPSCADHRSLRLQRVRFNNDKAATQGPIANPVHPTRRGVISPGSASSAGRQKLGRAKKPSCSSLREGEAALVVSTTSFEMDRGISMKFPVPPPRAAQGSRSSRSLQRESSPKWARHMASMKAASSLAIPQAWNGGVRGLCRALPLHSQNWASEVALFSVPCWLQCLVNL